MRCSLAASLTLAALVFFRLLPELAFLRHVNVEGAVGRHLEDDGIHVVDVLPDGAVEVVGDVYITPFLFFHFVVGK